MFFSGLLLSLLLTVAAASAALAFNIYTLGGRDGNPWQAALSAEPGTYAVLDRQGQLVQTQVLTSSALYDSWADTLNAFVDSTDGQWIRPFFIPPDLNLAHPQVRTRVLRGLNDNITASGRACGYLGPVRPMFDGDHNTAAFFTANASSDSRYRAWAIYVQNSIVDLGTDYPVNRVRFYPRLGTSNPKLDEVLDSMGEPRLTREDLLEEDFSENFLPWYEVAAANSSQNFPVSCNYSTAETPWFWGINGSLIDAPNDPRLVTLSKETENADVVVDIRFPPQYFQWVAVRPLYPIENWEIAEFEIYGEGFVPKAVYTTAVIDFGTSMAWGKIRWDGVFAEDSNVLIRTRTGNDADPNLYWVLTNIAGEVKELTRIEWERAGLNERFTSLDEENWSFWSAPYPLAAGQQDPNLDPNTWQDGTSILSPGPSRYLQVQLIFQSSLDQASALRQLEIQFAPPSALAVIGEIWPQDAPRSESTTFTYSVRPTFETNDTGFDRLEIFTLTRAEAIRAVRVDGVGLGTDFPAEILDDRILVVLPKLRGQGDTFKLIEVEFDAHVVRYGTQFQGWVFDSQGSGVKQLIEAGDANINFPGNSLGVRTDGLGSNPLSQIEVAPNPFTPNSDGINDQTFFRFQLHELSQTRQLEVDIYDLAGRRVRRLEQQGVVRGLFDQGAAVPTWDGRNDQGTRVPPGHYLYRIAVDTDGDTQGRQGTVSVAY